VKTKPISFNEEFIKGFIEGLLQEFELGLGPFLNKIHSYGILVMLHYDSESSRIVIPFTMEGDNREDLKTYFDLKRDDNLTTFRMKVQLVVEEIISHVNSFERESI
jgi:hypothetical protein